MFIMENRGNPVLKKGFFFQEPLQEMKWYVGWDDPTWTNKKTALLRILMRKVSTFHNMGSTSLEKYLKWGAHIPRIWLTPSSLAGLRMLSPSFTAGTDLAEVIKTVSSFCFLHPRGVYLSRVASLQEKL